MEEGLRDGRLTETRPEEAYARVLALATAGHVAVAEEVARRSVTLMKRQDARLPIDATRYPRVVVIADYPEMILPTMPRRSYEPFFGVLHEAGFAVREFDATSLPTPDDTDLVIYLVGGEATIGSTSHGLNWGHLHGGGFRGAMLRFWAEIPKVMVSFGQPYVLHDAPQVGTYVNAYTALPPWQRAVVGKRLGREAWEGVSPAGPFCGDASARFSAPLPHASASPTPPNVDLAARRSTR